MAGRIEGTVGKMPFPSLGVALFVLLVLPAHLPAAGPHYVFAHYMVCYATYGESLAAYEREINEAQAAGIDGFALDVGAWSGPDTWLPSRRKLRLIVSGVTKMSVGLG